MGKKQIRISDPVQIQKRIGEFIKKNITLVFLNNKTTFGLLLEMKGNSVTVQNGRLKKFTFPLADILEIYTDIDG